MTPSKHPPAAARALLERALPHEVREDVLPDLDELYRRRVRRGGLARARWWYRGQACSFALRFSWERLREHTPGRIPMKPRISMLDWKLGVRMLLRYPGLSLIGGLALTAAITIGVVWFEVIQEQLDPRIPLDDGDRIVRVESWDAAAAAPEPRLLHDFLVWREQVRTIEHLGAARTVERNLIAPGVRPRPVRVAELSASAFPLTRVPPLLGRPLVEADEQPGAEEVVVLGYHIWRSRFNADPGILGQSIQLGRTTATVVGVMPEGFAFPRTHETWVPLRVQSMDPREGPPAMVFGRLAGDATLELAQAELTAIGQRMAVAQPETHAQLSPRLVGIGQGRSAGKMSLPVFLAHLGVLLILAATSANVATLVFARTAMRESEIVVRSALGASRGRIVGQLFVESLVLALLAAALGIAAATGIIKFIWHQAVNVRQVPQAFWRNDHLEPGTVLYAVGLAVLGATLVALLPALKATGPQVRAGLSRMASGGSNMRFGGVWSVIIVFQVAFTVVCLPIGIGVTLETRNDYEVRGSFASGQYLTFRAEMDEEDVEDAGDPAYRTRLAAVYDELERRLFEESGVTGVTFADRLPGMSGPLRRMEAQRGSEAPFPIQANRDGVVQPVSVAPDLFETFQVPVVAGRGLSTADVGALTVVVNESLARNIGDGAVGARIRDAATRDGEPGPWYEVVGVVQNMNVEPTGRGEADFVFHAASPAGALAGAADDDGSRLIAPYVAVRMEGGPLALAPRLTEIALAVDPGLRIYEPLTLEEVIRRRMLPNLMAALGITIVVALALILSAAGLFALMSVSVARRSREIGIRAALGASRAGVLKAVFARSAAQLGTGIVLGNLVVAGLITLLGGGVQAETILALLGVSALMAVVGVLACAVPAWRALQVQPTEVLREAV